jgi:redox-sensitive bicupin YhaK (pirin superfamily)
LIQPGAVNWMTAGRGIAHSERTPAEVRRAEHKLFGIQSWVALPASAEEAEPTFLHFSSDSLPTLSDNGVQIRVVAGNIFGERSPVKVLSEIFYADLELDVGARVAIEADFEDRAVYVVSGSAEFLPEKVAFGTGNLLILKPGQQIVVSAGGKGARLMLLGGETFPEKRYIWWNFVSSSPERIEQAKSDWKEGKFGQVIGETEFIPLPADSRPAVPRYP